MGLEPRFFGVAVKPGKPLAMAVRERPDGTRAACIVLPWSLYMCAASAPLAWQSLLQAEHFPDTLNPGYFLIKIALLVLPVLLAVQALHALRRMLGAK